MPRACSICSHPKRAEIDAALAAGEGSYRDIARRWRVSKDAAARHRAEHLSAVVAVATAQTAALSVEAILGQVRDLNAKTFTILKAAETKKDGRLGLAAIREARENLSIITKLALLAEERAAREATAAGRLCERCDSGGRPEPTVEDMAESMAILVELTSDVGGFGEQIAAALARHGLAVVKVAAAPAGQP